MAMMRAFLAVFWRFIEGNLLVRRWYGWFRKHSISEAVREVRDIHKTKQLSKCIWFIRICTCPCHDATEFGFFTFRATANVTAEHSIQLVKAHRPDNRRVMCQWVEVPQQKVDANTSQAWRLKFGTVLPCIFQCISCETVWHETVCEQFLKKSWTDISKLEAVSFFCQVPSAWLVPFCLFSLVCYILRLLRALHGAAVFLESASLTLTSCIGAHKLGDEQTSKRVSASRSS